MLSEKPVAGDVAKARKLIAYYKESGKVMGGATVCTDAYRSSLRAV